MQHKLFEPKKEPQAKPQGELESLPPYTPPPPPTIESLPCKNSKECKGFFIDDRPQYRGLGLCFGRFRCVPEKRYVKHEGDASEVLPEWACPRASAESGGSRKL